MDQRRQPSFRTQPGGRLMGRLRVPGDKSISHRAVMLGAIAEGTTRIKGFLRAQDCLATLKAFQAMDVCIEEDRQAGDIAIRGAGLYGLQAPQSPLDLGNSGTSMRLLAGLLCGQPFDTLLIGDVSLMHRPMQRIAEPLTRMGAAIQTSTQGTPPLRIIGGQRLRGIEYHMPIASAQVKSSILLAGLYAQGRTCVIEPMPARDHTERLLAEFAYSIERQDLKVSLQGGGRLQAAMIEVPADISSAAYFMVGASIAPGSDVTLEHVGINPTRSGVIEILRRMGSNIKVSNRRMAGGEPVADIHVTSTALKGIHIPPELVPLAIDEFPAILIAAACARGVTVLTGAEELRVKESDRIQAMMTGLRACGINAEPTADGMIVRGGQLQGAIVDSHGDHRVAMAFAIAGLAACGDIIVRDYENVATSFPDFVAFSKGAGLDISVEQ
ncbi:MAG TPA: 3-phosphoshikimate 1-carboxyvinyltransferase [Gammaproteobacteria bacterium]|nr:3-phosphoshikimate 1-carboxyvinyltransferase [Gammaproteobacteria bacterium]